MIQTFDYKLKNVSSTIQIYNRINVDVKNDNIINFRYLFFFLFSTNHHNLTRYREIHNYVQYIQYTITCTQYVNNEEEEEMKEKTYKEKQFKWVNPGVYIQFYLCV